MMKRRFFPALAALLALWGVFPCFSLASPGLLESVQGDLRGRIQDASPPIRVDGEVILASVVLPRFYRERDFAPAWVGEDGPLNLTAALVAALDGAAGHGLDPGDYHANRIRRLLTRLSAARGIGTPPDPRMLADLDLMCTDGFLLLGAHLAWGKVSPETIEPTWTVARRQADLAGVLDMALASGEVAESLESLAPANESYQSLRRALESFSRDAGKPVLPKVAGVAMLRPGSRGQAVERLKARLAALGYLPGAVPEENPLFGPEIQGAVTRFQRDNGLTADGLAGPMTLEAVNADPVDRARTIALNLERWRWLPRNLGGRYIVVNITDFSLRVVEAGQEVMAMRAIVGMPFRKTPVFSARMTYMVLAPYWNVPPKIAVQDKLPLIRKDPAWLSENRMQVFAGWGEEMRKVDPATVNWRAFTAKNFPFHLRQDPGPNNALGSMKFMFPNKYNVYIHDTPAHDLFEKTQRAFSSGCIRIHEPMKLALYLLRSDPEWSEEAIRVVVAGGEQTIVSLPEPLPVHILYWTAVVQEDGKVVFRSDIYGRDEELARALFTPRPKTPEAP